MYSLVLASGSPRRAELLKQLGLDFDVLHPVIDEKIGIDESPLSYVSRMSSEKAANAREHLAGKEDAVVICADTIVVIDGKVLGKPSDRDAALSMLGALSGERHRVITSVTIFGGAREKSFQVETIVDFRPLTVEDKRDYWLTGEPVDKAGAYGIQGIGAIFVDAISGSYSNVVGLPLAETAQALKEFGIDCLQMLATSRT